MRVPIIAIVELFRYYRIPGSGSDSYRETRVNDEGAYCPPSRSDGDNESPSIESCYASYSGYAFVSFETTEYR